MSTDLQGQAHALQQRLVRLSQRTDDPRRAVWANELAHDATIRYLRRAGHPAYQDCYRAGGPRRLTDAAYRAMRRKQEPRR